MTIADMQYDFKDKLNKIDSQKYRNLRIQEVDWTLNEAQEILIKTIAEPRFNPQLGVELNQRSIDDLYTIVVEKYNAVIVPFGDNYSYRVVLPDNYWFLLNTDAIGVKGTCTSSLKCIPRKHDEQPEDSPFDRSSFEWQETNFRHYQSGIRFFTDGTFTINNVYLDYILKPPYIHYASGVVGSSYNLPDGTTLSGTQDCILPQGIHRELVDVAVLIATGKLQMSDYQVKQAKVKMND